MSSNLAQLLVLFVEAEPMIAEVLQAALHEGGYAVDIVPDGASGLSAVEARAEEYRALITDISLGGAVSGWDVARRGRELSPALTVVYVTGDSGHEWASLGVPGSLLVEKPFAPAQVVTAISSLLITSTPPPHPSGT